MARIVNVVNETHFVAINEGTRDNPDWIYTTTDRVVYIEHNGHLFECYESSMNLDYKFSNGITAEEILERNSKIEVGECAVMYLTDIMNIVEKRLKAPIYNNFCSEMYSLFRELKRGDIDLEIMLAHVLEILYNAKKEGRIIIEKNDIKCNHK